MKPGFYRVVPFEVYVEKERLAREAMTRHTDELLKKIRFMDPTAKITFVQDEIIIECSEHMKEQVAQVLIGSFL